MKKKISIASACLLLIGLAWLRFAPLPPSFLDTSHASSTMIVDRNGEVLFDGLSEAGLRSSPITADAIPRYVELATLAAEDKRFYHHPGVDPIAIARAAFRNAQRGRVVEGGSTITQQTVKLLIARGGKTPARSFARKGREALLAMQLEARLSKKEILALYLNLAPYGNQISGIQRASQTYFGLEASDLTLGQAAFLAGLPQKPAALNPYRNQRGANERKNVVLARVDQTSVPPDVFEAARREQVRVRKGSASLVAPHFVFAVQETLGGEKPQKVMTTLDAELQRSVRGIIDAHREKLDRHGANNVAVAVLHNATGEWLAWEGSGDYFDAEHGGAIDGVRARRQPGSTLKPFAYAGAFERGMSPSAALPDIPASFPTADPGVLYAPRNYDGRFRGPLLARQALAGSVNVPAVWLTAQSGSASLLRLLRAAGITTLEQSADYYGLGLILGGGEVTLEELVTAYSIFPRRGRHIAPALVRAERRLPGGRTAGFQPAARHVVSPRTAFLITDILDDDDAREFAFGRSNSLELPFPVAVKTGTSQAYHDNWTVGYTRDVTVGVWVGNFDRKPLRNSSGVTGAAPIFHAVMLEAQRRYGTSAEEIVTRPDNLMHQRVCLLSGLNATIACARVGEEWGGGGKSCDWHLVAQRNGERVTRTVWPPQYRAWAESAGLVADDEAPRGEVASSKPLQIISPAEGVVFLADPTLRREFQTAKLKAAVTGRSRDIEWRVDGQLLARAASDAEVRWPLRVGKHTIEARDDRGRVDRVAVTVK